MHSNHFSLIWEVFDVFFHDVQIKVYYLRMQINLLRFWVNFFQNKYVFLEASARTVTSSQLQLFEKLFSDHMRIQSLIVIQLFQYSTF